MIINLKCATSVKWPDTVKEDAGTPNKFVSDIFDLL